MTAGTGLGTWMLSRAWHSRGDAPAWRWGGWSVICATLIVSTIVDGVRGLALAFGLFSVVAIAIVATGLEVRPARSPREGRESLAPEPVERPLTGAQRTTRWLLAGPVGMIAAMAVGIAWSVWVPGAPQTRLAIGGLLVPTLWGGAMAWTLADDRIWRATAVLVGTAIAGFGIAILKGFA